MKTNALMLKGVLVLLVALFFSSCQTERSTMKSHMRQFEMVKVDPVQRNSGDRSTHVQVEEILEAIAMQGETGVEIAEQLMMEDPAAVLEMAEEAVSQLPLNRVQRFAANRVLRQAIGQTAGVAGIEQSGALPGSMTENLRELLREQSELKEQGKKRSSIDLLRLILYLLVALLIITVLGLLFSGYLFTIVVLVLLILGVMYLMGAV